MNTTKIIAIWIEKGGSGKTTTAVHTSALLADKGYRVLLVDADPQANASLHYSIEDNGNTLSEVLRGQIDAEAAIQSTDIAGLDLLPSAHRLEDDEQLLFTAGDYVLSEALYNIADQYDYILIDCPPIGLKQIRRNIMAAADGLIIPIDIDEYAMEGLLHVNNMVQDMRRTVNRELEVLGVLVTKDERGIIKQGYKSMLKEQCDFHVFETTIRKNSAIGKAAAAHMPVHQFERKSKAAIDYTDFTNELLEVIR